MATHSSILAWRIPWTGEPGGLQSMGLQRIMTEQLSTQEERYSDWEVEMWILLLELSLSHYVS